MSTTPTDTSPAQPHVDEVAESLERALTLLKRRTRDVLKLAQEREELIARIEGRTSRTTPAPAPVASDASLHGESTAAHHHEPQPGHVLDEASPEPAAPSTDDIAMAIVPDPSDLESDHREQQPDDGVASKWARPTISDVPETAIDRSSEVFTPEPEQHSHIAADDEQHSELEHDVAAEPEAAFYDATTIENDPGARIDAAEAAEVAAPEWAEPMATAGDETDTPAWETPDLEWSDDTRDIEAHVASEEFPHPMPPIDATEHADDRDRGADAPAYAAEETAEGFAPEMISDDVDSPFATEFTEHVEELGGRLEPSPFDLDTPPPPTSYRPRSFQTDAPAAARSDDAYEEGREAEPAGTTEAAWDDFAGTQDPPRVPDAEEPAPAATSGGSRLRDLVAQAQQSERERAAQEKSDFDLIHEDASVSRYDKNSAKLPTVGISSEELSSSVASLRSSFTSDKKGPSSRDDDKPSRSDKKAEKRAAKEAAKAAKAESKRRGRKG